MRCSPNLLWDELLLNGEEELKLENKSDLIELNSLGISTMKMEMSTRNKLIECAKAKATMNIDIRYAE